MDAVIEMTAEYASEDQSLSVINRMNLTTFQDPLKLKAEIALNMDSGEDTYSRTITMYARKEGEELVQYATDGSYWAKQTTTQEVLDTYNVGDTLAAYVAQASGFRKNGTETVNDADAEKYTGSISGKPLVDILESNRLSGVHLFHVRGPAEQDKGQSGAYARRRDRRMGGPGGLPGEDGDGYAEGCEQHGGQH